MDTRRPQSPLLWAFLILSLLLHLLLIYLLPQRSLFPTPPREPVYVEMRPPEPPPKPRERELDLPPQPETEQPRKTPAKRLGPQDQEVIRETAPKGDAPEDRRPPKPKAKPEPRPQAPPRVEPPPSPSVARQPDPAPTAPERPSPAPAPAKPAPSASPLPDLRTLTQLAPQTLARLEDEWRTKYRADVEQGDAVWLDTEKDILISFFQRFRNQVYNVWNYPARSVERQEEGTCLVKITVNRAGEVVKTQLLESSGYASLDNEAIDAVLKASPFGRLPRAYQKDELNVFAFFKYNLSRRIIY